MARYSFIFRGRKKLDKKKKSPPFNFGEKVGYLTQKKISKIIGYDMSSN